MMTKSTSSTYIHIVPKEETRAWREQFATLLHHDSILFKDIIRKVGHLLTSSFLSWLIPLIRVSVFLVQSWYSAMSETCVFWKKTVRNLLDTSKKWLSFGYFIPRTTKCNFVQRSHASRWYMSRSSEAGHQNLGCSRRVHASEILDLGRAPL